MRKLGLAFGIWVEPEMVNPDSDLYREHPEWAVQHPEKKPVLARNQMVLDLCQRGPGLHCGTGRLGFSMRREVSYVKWDMNRPIAEACSGVLKHQGEFYHRYIIGLYEVLTRVSRAPPPRSCWRVAPAGATALTWGCSALARSFGPPTIPTRWNA